MIIAGANIGSTQCGKALRDGGAAIVSDGELVFALAEERVSRVKAAKNVRYVDHHESHAALAFYSSSFSESLVIVIDAGGDVLSQELGTTEWWKQSRQQVSVYLGRNKILECVERQFDAPGECGLGEMFRAFTHYLGWPSGRHAGKTMALAAFGKSRIGDQENFYTHERHSGKLKARINQFEPFKPGETARAFLRSINRLDLIDAWEKDGARDAREEIAAIVQRSLETALIELISSLVEKYKIRKVCFAGGVALNCTAINYVREKLDVDVFVPAGSGDSGQCVGNAILGSIAETGEVPSLRNLPFIGPSYQLDENELFRLLQFWGVRASVNRYPTDCELQAQVARRIFSDEIVFLFQGKCEFGARALGNRSIIASTQSPQIVGRLNELKKREDFNPFAASCIKEDAQTFFENVTQSPFMTLAFSVRKEMRREFVKSIVHADGTCRAQVFDKDFNPSYYGYLREYKKLSGYGLLLNTSLNGPDEPIVETPSDCIKLFAKSEVSTSLVINEFLVTKL